MSHRKEDLQNKANYSLLLNDGYQDPSLDVYEGYVIDEKDPKAFNSEEEVNEYLELFNE